MNENQKIHNIKELIKDYSIETTPNVYEKYGGLKDLLNINNNIYITYLPDEDPNRVIDTAKKINEEGFRAVPHLPARTINDFQDLERYIGSLSEVAGCNKILVIGGTGFIGSHTCLDLLFNNHELYVVDSLINSTEISLQRVLNLFDSRNKFNKNKITFLKGDIRDNDFLFDVFEIAEKENNPIQGVIHLAGLKSASESFKDVINYYDVNVKGTINLLKVMEKFKCTNLVFSSSASVYNKSNEIPYKEISEINASSPYGESKLIIEKILSLLIHENKLNWKFIILRYFNVAGAHPSGKIGEEAKYNQTNLFPNLYNIITKKNLFLNIFGKTWQTFDGTQIRDFVHVMDIAEAHTKSLNYLLSNSDSFNIINLGSGKGNSVMELVRTFEEVNNCKIQINFTESRAGDTSSSIADICQAYKILKWRPRRNLDQICADGWNWIKKNPNGYF